VLRGSGRKVQCAAEVKEEDYGERWEGEKCSECSGVEEEDAKGPGRLPGRQEVFSVREV
jgi:hypothetical protein